MGVALGMGDPEAIEPEEIAERHPPRAVGVAGALWTMVGVGAVAEMAVGVIQDDFIFNVAVIGLWIGRDILKGRSWGRQWGRGLALLGACLSGLICLASLLMGDWLSGAHSGVALIASVWTFRLLQSEEAAAWFKGGVPRSRVWRDWSFVVLLVSGLLVANQTATSWHLQRAADGLFPVQVTLVAVDAESGERLDLVALDGAENVEVEPGLPSSLSKVSATIVSGGGHDVAEIRGVAFRSFEIGLAVAGYQREAVVIDERTPGKVEVEMTRRGVEE